MQDSGNEENTHEEAANSEKTEAIKVSPEETTQNTKEEQTPLDTKKRTVPKRNRKGKGPREAVRV